MDDKWLAGVCSAFARYLNVDLALVRILWLSAVIVFGTGVLAYLICWFIIPREQTAAFVSQQA
jgi:phage shock protein PspC (stress-responsive transcriptional regulator)